MRTILVVAVASLLALSCATVPPPLPAPTVVVLTGTVRASATSRPLSGAMVMLPGTPVRVTTNVDGRYRLAACLARGSRVALRASAYPYDTKWLPVRVDSDTVRVDLRLEPQSSHGEVQPPVEVEGDDVFFTGTIIDGTSSPVPGAVVSLGSDGAITGPDGRYKFVGRAAIGSHATLWAGRDGYYPTFQPVRVRMIRTVRADLRLSAVVPVEKC
jgi:hypothetical protein